VKRPRAHPLELAALGIVAAIWALPMLFVVSLSLQPNRVLLRDTPIVPRALTLENYARLAAVSEVPRWLLNSAIVASGVTVGTLVLSSLAGYAFARLEFRGKKALFAFVLAGMMVPGQALILPLHEMFAAAHLHNHYVALIAPGLSGPFGVFLMTQFWRAVPRELEEAAELDHASRLRTFLTILLPLARPALTTLGIFTFLGAYNDFFWPLVSATRTDMYTITVGLASLQGNFAQAEGLGFLMATVVFASAPTIALYVVFQRHIVRGVAGGFGA
jgi:multiple sugar transport system permease protein